MGVTVGESYVIFRRRSLAGGSTSLRASFDVTTCSLHPVLMECDQSVSCSDICAFPAIYTQVTTLGMVRQINCPEWFITATD